jgi:N-dimethylarginine dimethylaminohydrolase
MKRFNSSVIMSGAEYFDDSKAINILMDSAVPVNAVAAIAEHTAIKTALEDAGVIVFKTTTPKGLQDGVYVANWFVERNGRALMARLPNTRRPEEAYALVAAREAGLDTLNLPENIERFSGQGDALACGDVIFTHSPYRTVKAAHDYLKSWLGFTEIVALETKPARKFGNWGPRITNRVTGLPDSPTYDLDLALAILKWPDE